MGGGGGWWGWDKGCGDLNWVSFVGRGVSELVGLVCGVLWGLCGGVFRGGF